ncbi:MAG TPA: HAD family hydrolase [Spirochaetota bacterium]|nr:HAD family hydrolase [Spirochaetota bacterium]
MYTSKVREFTRACQDNLPERPRLMTREQIAFIKKMVNDELEELEQARDITEQADALADAVYYICDVAVRHGINLDPLFTIIHQANMNKIINGKVRRRDDGKILKPEGWQDPGPRLENEIRRQQREGAFQGKAF